MPPRVVRAIDSQRPVTKPQKYVMSTYRRAEANHVADIHIRHNERYNNEARVINRARGRGLAAARLRNGPPNGLIKMIYPFSGLTCPDAPYRLNNMEDLGMDVFVRISNFYDFGWNPNQAPLYVTPGPWTPIDKMIEDYKAFMGAN